MVLADNHWVLSCVMEFILSLKEMQMTTLEKDYQMLMTYLSKINAPFIAEENIVVGNVCFYGATNGKAFIRGLAGERFCT